MNAGLYRTVVKNKYDRCFELYAFSFICFFRTKQLEHFHSCVLKELEQFENDSQALKNMEKDFLVCFVLMET